MRKPGGTILGDWEVQIQQLRLELERKYGRSKPIMEKHGSPTRVLLQGGRYECEAFTSALGSYKVFGLGALEVVMDTAIAAINTTIGRLQSPVSLESVTSATTSAPPKAFMAHGGESAALNKLCGFLEALGVEPIVVEIQPSEGRLTEGQVDNYMKQADCAIILATYGHIEDVKTLKKHPRLNVVDELGRCRNVFPRRTVLLLEKGVDLPSNVSGIVHEHFTKQNMENAFIKVARELRASGLIKPMKPGR